MDVVCRLCANAFSFVLKCPYLTEQSFVAAFVTRTTFGCKKNVLFASFSENLAKHLNRFSVLEKKLLNCRSLLFISDAGKTCVLKERQIQSKQTNRVVKINQYTSQSF